MKFRAQSLAIALTLALGAIACGGDSTADDSGKIVDDTEQERSEEVATESDDDDSAPAEDVVEHEDRVHEVQGPVEVRVPAQERSIDLSRPSGRDGEREGDHQQEQPGNGGAHAGPPLTGYAQGV